MSVASSDFQKGPHSVHCGGRGMLARTREIAKERLQVWRPWPAGRFANRRRRCENVRMRKPLRCTAIMAAYGIFLLAAPAARTQQSSPAPAKPTTGSASAASSKGTAATTAKPHTATTAKTPAPLVLKTDKDKTSYALGMTIG